MYCLKCKRKTDSANITQTVTKNKRMLTKATCTVCNSKKSCFSKQQNSIEGKGFLNGIIEKLPIELHLPAKMGEYVTNGSFNNLQKYSYCGPGTRYDQRTRERYKGINELDSMCKLHDQFYNENSDTKSRNISDLALAHRANEIATDPKFDATQRRDAALVGNIMKNKARFGLGIKKSLNCNEGLMKRK
jgi:hypothetical protein